MIEHAAKLERRTRQRDGMPCVVILLHSAVLVMLLSGCSAIRPSAPLSPDEALLKITIRGPDGRANHCTAIICDINGTFKPPVVWGTSPRMEVNDRGSSVMWALGVRLTPGKQQIRIENGQCQPESRIREYVTAGAMGLVVGGVLAAPLTLGSAILTHAIDDAMTRPPVVFEFDAKAGKSYIVDCDRSRTPWVWITPEDDR